MSDRAKQFIAFMALTGYEELIAEAEHYYEPRLCLSEDQLAKLDYALQELQIGSLVRVSYYVKDSYVLLTGEVKKIIPEERRLLIDTESIFLDDIADLEVVS